MVERHIYLQATLEHRYCTVMLGDGQGYLSAGSSLTGTVVFPTESTPAIDGILYARRCSLRASCTCTVNPKLTLSNKLLMMKLVTELLQVADVNDLFLRFRNIR